LVINDKGEILGFHLSTANVDVRDIDVMQSIAKEVFGKLFGDKGYISNAMADLLFQDGIS
jgi:DDE family transposase